MARGRSFVWTEEHWDFIYENYYNMTRRELLEALHSSFDDIDESITLPSFRAMLRRKGLRNKNYRTFNDPLPIGAESYRHNLGQMKVKVSSNPSRWVLKSRYVWEKHNGELPDGYVVRFLDGDTENYDIDNLVAIPMAANMTANHINKANTLDPELNKAILLTETLRHEIRKLRK